MPWPCLGSSSLILKLHLLHASGGSACTDAVCADLLLMEPFCKQENERSQKPTGALPPLMAAVRLTVLAIHAPVRVFLMIHAFLHVSSVLFTFLQEQYTPKVDSWPGILPPSSSHLHLAPAQRRCCAVLMSEPQCHHAWSHLIVMCRIYSAVLSFTLLQRKSLVL